MIDVDREDLQALVDYLQHEALPYNERGRRCARALTALEQLLDDRGSWEFPGDTLLVRSSMPTPVAPLAPAVPFAVTDTAAADVDPEIPF